MTATLTEIEQVVEESKPSPEEVVVHGVCAWHGEQVLPLPVCGTKDLSGWAPEDAVIDCPMCVEMIISNVVCPTCGSRMQSHEWAWPL